MSQPASVSESLLPEQSAIDRRMVDGAHFKDAYRVSLSKDAAAVQVFQAVFAHHPWWMKLVLIVRNVLASAVGLATPSMAEVLHPTFASGYAVGQKIGVWPIFAVSATELIVGRDNKHLDFRLSVLTHRVGAMPSATISTVCLAHNAFGRLYLLAVAPFHKFGLRRLLRSAVVEGRV